MKENLKIEDLENLIKERFISTRNLIIGKKEFSLEEKKNISKKISEDYRLIENIVSINREILNSKFNIDSKYLSLEELFDEYYSLFLNNGLKIPYYNEKEEFIYTYGTLITLDDYVINLKENLYSKYNVK